MKFQTKLKQLDACKDAIEWAKDYKTFQEVWDNCERADWLLWIAGNMSDKGINTRKDIVLCACKCARLSLKHMPKDEKRPLKAIQTAERWAKGKATIGEVRSAANAAYAAAYAAYAANAAYAAAYAAYAANAANAAYAANAAAYAAEHKKMCKIIRKMLKCPL